MPGRFCGECARQAIHHLTLTPLRVITTPYHRWREQRRIEVEAREAQQRINAAADEAMVEFHEELWGHWPDIVARAREHARKESNRE
jgi:hypothetical protein